MGPLLLGLTLLGAPPLEVATEDELMAVNVTGQPCGKARHRTRIIAPKGRKAFVSEYVDERDPNVTWERFVQAEAAKAWSGKAPLDEPVCVYVVAIGQRPASVPKSLGRGRLWRIGKPDGDNGLKAVCDGLKQGGIFVDDTRCSRKLIDSLVAADGEAPHTLVHVYRLPPLPLVPWPARPSKTRAPASPGTLL